MRKWIVGNALCAAMVAGASTLAVTPVSAQEADCTLSPAKIYANAQGSIVQVLSLSINPFLVSGRVEPSLGTGFMIGDGLILTNYHVVADSDDITVFLDKEAYRADVVGIDPTLDIAVVAPDTGFDVIAPLQFADPADIAIGQDVFVIGYPFGLGKSISHGIVSGMGRVLQSTTASWLSPYIQTDAAVSPGNSGGPLLDGCGRVVGLISQKIVTPGADNLAFAIPISVLAPVVEELAENGHVARPWHGLYGQMVTPPILQMLGVPPWEWDAVAGFLVETVEPGSAADRAGLAGGVWPVMWGGTQILLGGDIITEVNGVRIDSLDTALNTVRALKIGETVTLKALRYGDPVEASVVLEERPLLEREMELYRHPPG